MRHGFRLEAMPDVLFEGERVSSSAVRGALARGSLRRAERLLGHPIPQRPGGARREAGAALAAPWDFPPPISCCGGRRRSAASFACGGRRPRPGSRQRGQAPDGETRPGAVAGVHLSIATRSFYGGT